MPSLLKRWLHKFHGVASLDHRPRDCKDVEERLEPTVLPTRYVCEESTSEFVKYWTNIKDDDGEGLEEIQLNALARWHALHFEWKKSIEEHPIPLHTIFGIFDDYFFLGALRPYTEVKLADDTQENYGWAGTTECRKQTTSSEPPSIDIKLKPTSSQLWVRTLIQWFLETLLHEMIHAFFIIYSAPVRLLGCNRKIAETEDLTGHGPCWVKVAAAIVVEADSSLGGLWHKWDLGIKHARSTEVKAPQKWHGYKGLNMMDG